MQVKIVQVLSLLSQIFSTLTKNDPSFVHHVIALMGWGGVSVHFLS